MNDQDPARSPTPDDRRTDYLAPDEHRTVAELVARLGEDVTTLVRQEAALARAEVTEKLTQLGRGAALAAAGGLVLYAGLLALVFAAIQALGIAIDLWLAAVVVAAVVLVIGYAVLQIGLKQLGRSSSMPKRTVDALREDKELLTEALDRRR